MKMQLRSAILLTVAILPMVGYVSQVVGQAAKSDELPAPSPAVSAEPRADQLSLQYALVNLKLAQLDLQEALDANRRVAGLRTTAEVNRRRQAVRVAEARVAQLRAGQAQLGDYNLLLAQANREIARGDLLRAMNANKRVANSVKPVELQRLRLEAERADVALARAEFNAQNPSIHADVVWQLDELREQIEQLRKRTEIGVSRIYYY